MLGRRFALRLAKLVVAVGMLAGLYAAADWRAVARALGDLHGAWLAAALTLFVPQMALSAFRWRSLAAPLARISFAESIRQTLAASALNLVVPSKLGDLSKAAMLPVSRVSDRARAGGLAFVEKGADVAALAMLWIGGIAGLSGLALAMLLALIAALACVRRWRGNRCYATAVASLTLWSLHLLQIDWFLKAAGVFLPWSQAAARLPAAIFAGLVPISFCGIGTRDSALVWLFSDVAPAQTMAVVGLLTALRYLAPGAAGIPFVLKGSVRKAEAAQINSALAAGAPAV